MSSFPTTVQSNEKMYTTKKQWDCIVIMSILKSQFKVSEHEMVALEFQFLRFGISCVLLVMHVFILQELNKIYLKGWAGASMMGVFRQVSCRIPIPFRLDLLDDQSPHLLAFIQFNIQHSFRWVIFFFLSLSNTRSS